MAWHGHVKVQGLTCVRSVPVRSPRCVRTCITSRKSTAQVGGTLPLRVSHLCVSHCLLCYAMHVYPAVRPNVSVRYLPTVLLYPTPASPPIHVRVFLILGPPAGPVGHDGHDARGPRIQQASNLGSNNNWVALLALF